MAVLLKNSSVPISVPNWAWWILNESGESYSPHMRFSRWGKVASYSAANDTDESYLDQAHVLLGLLPYLYPKLGLQEDRDIALVPAETGL